MKLVCYPALDTARAARVADAVGDGQVVHCATTNAAAAAIVDADAFFGKLTPQILAPAKKLRWVQSPTASLEHYLFDDLVRHPCTLTNMRGIFSDVIADHVLGYVLCFARNLHIYLRRQQQALWQPVGGEADGGQDFVVGPGVVTSRDRAHLHLADCTLGVVGLGGIGLETAARAQAFGMRVVGYDPQPVAAAAERVELCADLVGLLPLCNFVVICAPHTPETEGLFDRAMLRRMRADAYLINIGRGAVVKLADLAAALAANEIAGAALDVFESEPLPKDSPLWAMPNVLITPHVAACSPRIAARHLEALLDNIRRFAGGAPLRNVVDKSKWY